MASSLTSLESAALIAAVVSGLGGLCLGIYNTFRAQRDQQPQLGVVFSIKHVVDRTHGPGGPVEENVGLITITNPGRVAVTGQHVGISAGGKTDYLVISPSAIDGAGWPREVGPGQRALLRFDPASLLEQVSKPRSLRRAFVTSVVGETFYGKRKDTRCFARELERFQKIHVPPA